MMKWTRVEGKLTVDGKFSVAANLLLYIATKLRQIFTRRSRRRHGAVVNPLVSINELALHRDRVQLLLGWTTVCSKKNYPFKHTCNDDNDISRRKQRRLAYILCSHVNFLSHHYNPLLKRIHAHHGKQRFIWLWKRSNSWHIYTRCRITRQRRFDVRNSRTWQWGT